MGIFQRFEKGVEGAVSGVFARAFKGDVQPVEIAARLQRELDTEAKLMSRDKKLVPNDFTVELSQHDHDKLAPYAATLTRELGDELRSHAADRGYVFSGPIHIDLALDTRLPTGRFTVSSEAVAGVAAPHRRPGAPADRRPARPTHARRTARPSARTTRARELVLEVNGMRHPLQPPGPGHRPRHRGRPAHQRPRHLPAARRDPGRRRAPTAASTSSTSARPTGSPSTARRCGTRCSQEGSRIEIGTTRMLVHDPSAR